MRNNLFLILLISIGYLSSILEVQSVSHFVLNKWIGDFPKCASGTHLPLTLLEALESMGHSDGKIFATLTGDPISEWRPEALPSRQNWAI